jgi:alpha-mannosidase
MWSMDEEGYRRAFLEMLDYYLDQAEATKGNPPPQQGRWNCDGSLWLWTYERNRSAADVARLIDHIRSGHISAPLNAVVSCYGGQPTEAVLRGMYYAGSLERRFGLRFPLAVAMENQTLPYGLGALWSGAGAKYSWKGICGCASRMPQKGAMERQHEIYWWQGADGSRILLKWNSMLGPRHEKGMGGYAEAFYPAEVVEHVDSDPDFLRRYPYRVIGAFGKGWDRPKTLTDEFIEVSKAKTTAGRQVIVSNEADFFTDFERTYGGRIPTFSAAFGNEWDLYSASMPEVSAQVRRAVEKLRTAEAMAALVSLQQPGFMQRRAAVRERAWMNLGLYWEHNWTADSTIIPREENAAWHRRLAAEIDGYVDALYEDAARALGALILRRGSRPRFFVFNGLSWTRSDVADLPLSVLEPLRMKTHFPKIDDSPAPQVEPPLPLHVVEVGNGQEVPAQIVNVMGNRFLRVLAREVPAVGYKVYEVRPGEGAKLLNAARAGDGVLENEFYKIKVAERGAITSLIDKQRGNREVVREINGRAANDLGPGSGTVQVENTGPVSVTLRADAAGPLAHTTRVTLVHGSRRIEIENEITQNSPDVWTWGFGFDLEKPDVWHEEVGAVIRAKLLSDGGHYSPRNARYDWLTLNHFADIGGADGFGATLSNADCAFMQLGHSTPERLDTTTPLLSVLGGGQVDGPKLGIPNQGGDSHFTQRFALQTRGPLDGPAAMRFALEHQNRLAAGIVIGGRPYPETEYSFLTLSDSQPFVWALKPPEDGSRGVVLRLWNQTHKPLQTAVRFSSVPADARTLTHIESDVGEAPLEGAALPVYLEAQQLRTFLIRFSAGARP